MQTYVWFLEAEPGKHPIVIKSRIRIPGHLEIIGAFSGARRRRSYRGSHPRQIALRLSRTFCYVFVHFTSCAFCHGCILPLSFFHGGRDCNFTDGFRHNYLAARLTLDNPNSRHKRSFFRGQHSSPTPLKFAGRVGKAWERRWPADFLRIVSYVGAKVSMEVVFAATFYFVTILNANF